MASYAILTNGYRKSPSNGTHITDWTYSTYNNSTIILQRYIGTSTIVQVPARIANMNVVLAGTTNTNSQNVYNGQPFASNPNIEAVIVDPEVGTPGNVYQYFYGCTNLKTVDWPKFNYSYNFAGIFRGCTNLIRVNTPNWYCTNSRNTSYAFANCYNLIESPVHFNGSTYLNGGMDMFTNCYNLTTIPVDADGTNTTIYLNSDQYVSFRGCKKLKNIPIRGGSAGQDSFHDCHSLETQPNCYYNYGVMNNMFKNCYNLKGTITLVNGGYVSGTMMNLSSVCENCYNISGVSFASGANRLYLFNNAFRNCYNLTSVGAINNTSYVSDISNAFRDCTKLTAVPWGWSSANCFYAYYNTGITTAFTGTPSNSINYYYTFGNCKNLTSIGNINGYRYTPLYYTFSNCTNLTSVSYIQNAYLVGTFEGCNNLTTINSLINIHSADNAFRNCKNLTEVNQASINGSCQNVFASCSNLRYVNYFYANSTSNNAFRDCVNLRQFNNATTLYYLDNAFRNCSNLTNINLTSSANTYYMQYAFANCTNLKTITMASPYMWNAAYMCQGCTSLTDFTINYVYNSTQYCNYSNYAFAQCKNLININTISQNNTSNRVSFYFYNTPYMFQDCEKLNKIPFNGSYFYNTINCFENCANLKTAVINHPAFNIFLTTFKDTNITSIDAKTTGLYIRTPVSTTFPLLTSFNGYFYHYNANSFSNCPNLTTVTNLGIRNSSYANYLFQNCKKLTSVTFNNTASFSNGYGMFKDCSNLTTTSGNIYVTSDTRYMFDNCVKLTGNIFLNYTNIAYMTGMFNNTSLSKNLYIPFTRNNTTTYNSVTYNTAIANGINGINGVTLKNIWAI